jgi:hypothetical protein
MALQCASSKLRGAQAARRAACTVSVAPRARALRVAVRADKSSQPTPVKEGLVRIINEDKVGEPRRASMQGLDHRQERMTRGSRSAPQRHRPSAQLCRRQACSRPPLLSPFSSQIRTVHIAETMLPTRHGNFRLRGYKHSVRRNRAAHGPGRTAASPAARPPPAAPARATRPRRRTGAGEARRAGARTPSPLYQTP